MSIRAAELSELAKVVRGVLTDGRYICLMGDCEVRRAISRCRMLGCSEMEINQIISDTVRVHNANK